MIIMAYNEQDQAALAACHDSASRQVAEILTVSQGKKLYIYSVSIKHDLSFN